MFGKVVLIVVAAAVLLFFGALNWLSV